MLPRSGVQLLQEKKTGHRIKKQGAEEKKQGFGLTEVWVAVMAKVASVGVAVVPVSHRGSNVGNGGVEGKLVRHEGAVVGVGGGHAGVVVGKGVGLGVSLRKWSVMINLIKEYLLTSASASLFLRPRSTKGVTW